MNNCNDKRFEFQSIIFTKSLKEYPDLRIKNPTVSMVVRRIRV